MRTLMVDSMPVGIAVDLTLQTAVVHDVQKLRPNAQYQVLIGEHRLLPQESSYSTTVAMW